MASDIDTLIIQFGQAVSVLNATIGSVVVLVLIFLMGIIIGKLLGKLTRRLLGEIKLDKRIHFSLGPVFSLEGFIAGLVSWFFYLSSLILVLGRIGILSYIVNSFITAVVIVLVLIFLLGVKDAIPNVIAGLQLHRRVVLRPGRRIAVGHAHGVIEKVDWTCLEIRGTKGEHIVVPYVLALRHMTQGKKKE